MGLYEQWNSVINAGTVIDRSHESVVKHKKKNRMQILEEVFGRKIGLEWLFPRKCQQKMVIEDEYYFNKN